MAESRLFLFLRAVNVGRLNKVPMKQLVAAVAAEGLGKADYLLHSGNLIFAANGGKTGRFDVKYLKTELERIILERFAVNTVVVARPEGQLEKLLIANPFDAPTGGSVQVSMWHGEPDADGWTALAAEEFGADRLHLRLREAYMSFGASSHDSRLGNALIERRLKVLATSRNVRTLERLLQLPRN